IGLTKAIKEVCLFGTGQLLSIASNTPSSLCHVVWTFLMNPFVRPCRRKSFCLWKKNCMIGSRQYREKQGTLKIEQHKHFTTLIICCSSCHYFPRLGICLPNPNLTPCDLKARDLMPVLRVWLTPWLVAGGYGLTRITVRIVECIGY